MASINLDCMRSFLSRSIPNLNANKINGIRAESSFRNHVAELGYEARVSPGGWIARSTGKAGFATSHVVLFPEILQPDHDYQGNAFAAPPQSIHTVCATFHQLGIRSFFCRPVVGVLNDYASLSWHARQLGIPEETPVAPLLDLIDGYDVRERAYGFLRYNTDPKALDDTTVASEFSMEHLRIHFHSRFMAEISDVDGIFWGNQQTYPVEVKEKTAGYSNKLGHYFGLDVHPFVKLAFYAARQGNMHSLYAVREIDNVTDRNLVQWWAIRYTELATSAAWTSLGGGTAMTGGASHTIAIPRAAFSPLDANFLANL